MVIGLCDHRQTVAAVDHRAGKVDRLDHRVEIKPVRNMKLGAVIERAALRHQQKNGDFVCVIDLGQRIDHRHQPRCPHQRHRARTRHESARAQANRRFFPVGRHMGEAVVLFEPGDGLGNPVIGQAGDKGDPGIGTNIHDLGRHLQGIAGFRRPVRRSGRCMLQTVQDILPRCFTGTY